MKILRFILFPFSIFYGVITVLRNFLYRVRIFRSFKFSIPIINVGNLSTGGTGKTPHVEYLIKLLKDSHQMATLSRGYGRKEFGFKIANENSTPKQIGDEPMQFYTKFKNEIEVVVESNRVKGVMDLCYQKEDINLVVLDDAYQHRAIQPGFNILLTTFQTPLFKDFILPVGNLRELRLGKNRADIVIVTKCSDFNEIDKAYFSRKLKLKTNQSLFFSKIKYGEIKSFQNNQNIDSSVEKIILVTGIANAKPLVNQLKKNYTIIKHFDFSDHYRFKAKDIHEIHNLLVKFADEKIKIITTEKDAMRLIYGDYCDEIKKFPWFYQEIEIEINEKEKFDNLILKYVQENRRDY